MNSSAISIVIGFFIGCVFGVGCALAVMNPIYIGGYSTLKFDSDSERRFATILEDDAEVVKWLKPPKDVLKIHYSDEENYNPDFIAETTSGRYLCEIKRATDMDDSIVQKKAKAAIEWCERATTESDKPWKYALLPHDQIHLNQTFLSLVQQ